MEAPYDVDSGSEAGAEPAPALTDSARRGGGRGRKTAKGRKSGSGAKAQAVDAEAADADADTAPLVDLEDFLLAYEGSTPGNRGAEALQQLEDDIANEAEAAGRQLLGQRERSDSGDGAGAVAHVAALRHRRVPLDAGHGGGAAGSSRSSSSPFDSNPRLGP